MLEKRRHPRRRVSLPVTIRHGGRLIPATMLNLSNGGMYVRIGDADARMDRPVEAIFDIAGDHKNLSMSGRIKHMESVGNLTGLGVQFHNLYSLSYRAVQDLLG